MEVVTGEGWREGRRDGEQVQLCCERARFSPNVYGIVSVSRYASYTREAIFLMIFTTRVNSNIGTTIVVPDS